MADSFASDGVNIISTVWGVMNVYGTVCYELLAKERREGAPRWVLIPLKGNCYILWAVPSGLHLSYRLHSWMMGDDGDRIVWMGILGIA